MQINQTERIQNLINKDFALQKNILKKKMI